jgi:hypothetical protein
MSGDGLVSVENARGLVLAFSRMILGNWKSNKPPLKPFNSSVLATGKAGLSFLSKWSIFRQARAQ